MNVKDFEYLVILGKYRSISKAAQELYISQPALSKFLQKTEFELGTPLFQRVGKTLIPTPAGEYCLEKAADILFLHQQAVTRCNDITHLSCGQIKLGLPMSRTNYVISQILPAFYKKYPGIRISIYEDATALLIKKLRAGELDLIYINFTDNIQYPDLLYNPISEEEMVLAVPQSYGLASFSHASSHSCFPVLPINAWKELPFIMLEQGQSTLSFVRDFFQKNEISPNIILSIRNLGQALYAVRQGLGVTITPSIPIFESEEPAAVSYFSLSNDRRSVHRRTAIVHRGDAYLSQAEKGLIEIMAAQAHPF